MKGWRTIAFNVAGFLAVALAAPEIQALMPESWLRWAVAAAFAINVGLRIITTTPAGRAE